MRRAVGFVRGGPAVSSAWPRREGPPGARARRHGMLYRPAAMPASGLPTLRVVHARASRGVRCAWLAAAVSGCVYSGPPRPDAARDARGAMLDGADAPPSPLLDVATDQRAGADARDTALPPDQMTPP